MNEVQSDADVDNSTLKEHQHEYGLKVAMAEKDGIAIRFCKMCGKTWMIRGTVIGWQSHWVEVKEPW